MNDQLTSNKKEPVQSFKGQFKQAKRIWNSYKYGNHIDSDLLPKGFMDKPNQMNPAEIFKAKRNGLQVRGGFVVKD